MVSTRDPDDVVAAWFEAASQPDIAGAIEEIHQEIADAIRRIGPLCLASGQCCRFEQHGHRLYATGLEVARCVSICRGERLGITVADVEASVEEGVCPWQLGRLCTAREGRPTGCRVFFCDPRAAELVPVLAEDAHTGIQAIHERFGVPYRYGEWRAMLRMVLEQGDA